MNQLIIALYLGGKDEKGQTDTCPHPSIPGSPPVRGPRRCQWVIVIGVSTGTTTNTFYIFKTTATAAARYVEKTTSATATNTRDSIQSDIEHY